MMTTVRGSILSRIADTGLVPEHAFNADFAGIDFFSISPMQKVPTKKPTKAMPYTGTGEIERITINASRPQILGEALRVVGIPRPKSQEFLDRQFEVYEGRIASEGELAIQGIIEASQPGSVLDRLFTDLQDYMFDLTNTDAYEEPIGRAHHFGVFVVHQAREELDLRKAS